MTVTNPALPLYAADVERTCLPLEQATMLPGAAYTDYSVYEWERANFFRGGWICAGHVEQVGARGKFLTLDVGGENVFVIGDDDGLPRAFLNTCRHRGARLLIAPEGNTRRHPVLLPRLDLRLRRQPQERAVHRGPGRLRPEVLRAARGPARGRRGPRAARPLRRGAAAAGRTSATSRRCWRIPQRRPAARRADRLRRRRQLEGDRRELQRVPALPGRAPGAQPALALPERRDDRAAPATGAAAR